MCSLWPTSPHSSTPAPGDHHSTLFLWVQLFLDSIKWDYAVFVFLWLTCFTYHDAFKIYLFSCKWQDTLLFYDWTNCIYIITVSVFFLYSFIHQWTLRLFPCLGYSELYERPMFNFLRNFHTIFHNTTPIYVSINNSQRFSFLHIVTNTGYLSFFFFLFYFCFDCTGCSLLYSLSLVAASRGYFAVAPASLCGGFSCCGEQIQGAPGFSSCGLRALERGFSSCGTWAQFLCCCCCCC